MITPYVYQPEQFPQPDYPVCVLLYIYTKGTAFCYGSIMALKDNGTNSHNQNKQKSDKPMDEFVVESIGGWAYLKPEAFTTVTNILNRYLLN